ncbi:MAG TPA: AtpZ/AtpI family protein [Patescibacteria group bacterium]|nr:AtpZ/AtpI family protein [Patescibacteria group bacterium]
MNIGGMERPVEGGDKKRPSGKVSDHYYVTLALRIAADFGISIAVPAVAATFLGTWLDTRFGTDPLFLIICLVAAFTLTALWLYKKAKKYAVMYNKEV